MSATCSFSLGTKTDFDMQIEAGFLQTEGFICASVILCGTGRISVSYNSFVYPFSNLEVGGNTTIESLKTFVA